MNEEMLGVFLVVGIVVTGLLIGLLPTIFYLLSLHKALKRCQPHNRLMEPGLVWLMFIPFFNLIWHFFIVARMAVSLRREFDERGITGEPEPGRAVGLAMCILNACSVIPYLGIMTGLGSFICWIIYWVKIADCSARLGTAHPSVQPVE